MAKGVTYRSAWRGAFWGIFWCVSPAVVGAAVPKGSSILPGEKEFFRPELYISTANAPLADVIAHLPNRAAWEAFAGRRAADGSTFHVFIDPRSGAATNIMGAVPLIPGNGVGNSLTADLVARRLGLKVGAVDAAVVAEATLAHVRAHRALLGIDASQLGAAKATSITPELWQVTIPQQFLGVPVRHGRLAASISHGNLVTIGTETWGNVALPGVTPSVLAEAALEAGFAHVGGRTAEDDVLRKPALEIVPVASPEYDAAGPAGAIGRGYAHRLVWTFVFRRGTEAAQWEVLVDGHSGEVLALTDQNQYSSEHVTGGVYPVTNTEVCPTPQKCGTMQPGFPMPFADTGFPAPNDFTNSAGVYNYTSGTANTTLTGRFVRVNDNCGAISESGVSIAMGGVNGQHDCESAGTSPGNTASSRSAFYEVNKLAEMGRGYLPGNTWLQAPLTTNVNLPQTCNAFWNGSTINFYRSGGGCRNTGEIAGVFDHEWGHGLDDNDANGSLSSSSEGYADIAAMYRTQDSCIGHGFFETVDFGCGQSADGLGFNIDEDQTAGLHCTTDCSGVRDADWGKHVDELPDTALGHVCGRCNNGLGPCGKQVHCAAAPQRQAAWDLVARDLVLPPFNMDSQSAFITGNKLFYQGSGNIGQWYACACGSSSSGCAAANGYIQWLTADDDNGNLNDGTPHITAIFNAFNRHGIACSVPVALNTGCSGGPTAAPNLSASVNNYRVALSWNGVPGATRYWVFRTEGHAGCNYGKALIAEVPGTSGTFADTQVAADRSYSYNVVAAGASSACYSRASNCATETPTRGNYTIACAPSTLGIPGNNAATCTVSSTGGYSHAVTLGCSGVQGLSCDFSPATLTVPPNGTASTTLTVSHFFLQPGQYAFKVRGTPSPNPFVQNTTQMSLIVNGPEGDLFAAFDPRFRAPSCGETVGRSCDTGALVRGRATFGPEPNHPNTLFRSCVDGNSTLFHPNGANDRIRVVTRDGLPFAPGKVVVIVAEVRATPDFAEEAVDFFFAADATQPQWELIETIVPTTAGPQTLQTRHLLPEGGLQAVRVQLRRNGTPEPCAPGSLNDRDDLVFAVGQP
jgi:trimeric autotransporter adhesin